MVPSQVSVRLRVEGSLLTPAGGDLPPRSQPIAVEANFDFTERADEAAGPGGVARSFDVATASIATGRRSVRQELAEDARHLLVAIVGTTPSPFLPGGVIGRAEADLLDVPFDAAILDALRPTAPVAEGDSWEVAADVAAGLLGTDTISSGALRCTLEALEADRGRVRLDGVVAGAVDGVPTRIVIDGSCLLEGLVPAGWGGWSATGRVSSLEATLAERRQAGFVAPGFDVQAKVTVKRSPADRDSPADAAGPLAGVTPARPAGPTRPGLVWHRHVGGRYDLVLDRRWRVVEDGPEGLVMRLVDAGALVAQCSILPLPRTNPAEPPSLEQVSQDVARSLSGQFGHVAAADEAVREDGTRLVRIVAEGTAEGRPFRWIHHVVIDPDGHRAAVTCMLEPSLEARFAAADRDLVGGLRLLGDGVAAPPDRSAALPEKPGSP